MPSHNNQGNILGYRLHELFIRPFPNDADPHKVRIEVYNHTRVRILDVRVRRTSAFVVYGSDEAAAMALEVFERTPLFINGTKLEVNYTIEYADDDYNKHASNRRDRSPAKRLTGNGERSEDKHSNGNSDKFSSTTSSGANAYIQKSGRKNGGGGDGGWAKGGRSNRSDRSRDRHREQPRDRLRNRHRDRSRKLEPPFYREIKDALAEFSGAPEMTKLSTLLERTSLNPSIYTASHYRSCKCSSIHPVCGFFPESTPPPATSAEPPVEELSVKQLQRMYMELVGKEREKKPKERSSKKKQGAVLPQAEPQPLPLGMGRGFCRGYSEIKGLQESFSVPPPLPPRVTPKLGRGILAFSEEEIQSRFS